MYNTDVLSLKCGLKRVFSAELSCLKLYTPLQGLIIDSKLQRAEDKYPAGVYTEN